MEDLKEQYDSLCKEKNVIDLTRGKPSPEQLNLSEELDGILDGNFILDGIDIRNYGEIKGLPSARKLGAELLDYSEEFILASSNSSLTLMGNLLSSFLFNGSGDAPWNELVTVSIICPVPGYDRHFALCEKLGIKMIKVPLIGDGPDMNIVEDLVKNDESIKGIWCNPKHSNPTGEIYSQDTVKRIANLPLIGASDFIVLWDNAYAVHDFTSSKKLSSIQEISQELNTFDNVGSNYQESIQYPSLNVRGIESGWVREEVRTIVPSECIAEIDVRLVLESDPKRLHNLIKKHIKDLGYVIMDRRPTKEERLKYNKIVTFISTFDYDAFRTDIDSDIGKWLVKSLKNIQIRVSLMKNTIYKVIKSIRSLIVFIFNFNFYH